MAAAWRSESPSYCVLRREAGRRWRALDDEQVKLLITGCGEGGSDGLGDPWVPWFQKMNGFAEVNWYTSSSSAWRGMEKPERGVQVCALYPESQALEGR